ncbi:MAG TPA: N-acetylmuramoyl-L-alanine amidase, partial [Bacteroidia bacterium]
QVPVIKGEYYEEIVPKKTIYIHHTAGGHRPDWTIHGWNADKSASGGKNPVATAFVIGGLSTTDQDASWDGVICRCFPEEKWAHHLGTKAANNTTLNKESIGIEICNYGPITKGADGVFYNYVKKPVPVSMIVELAKPFQGYKYYHKYTDRQIAALKELIVDLGTRFKIDVKSGLKTLLDQNKGTDAFLLNTDALAGKPGVWTHTNVRKDKFDCSPQDNLISMLKSL